MPVLMSKLISIIFKWTLDNVGVNKGNYIAINPVEKNPHLFKVGFLV